MLQRSLFRDVLTEQKTTLNINLAARTSNVKLAASLVNGTILNPGDEFSYNKIVGPRTYERGFKDALIFQQGEIVDGTGGGICQVSSTLYMATLYSDLEVVERRNHRFTVTYTKLGEDATVVYGSTDYRFKNNTKYPIKIFTSVTGSTLKVTFLGTKTSEKTVKLQTNILQQTPYAKKTIEDPTLEYGKTKVKTEGHTGYKTETYRVVYENGVEVGRTLENKSTYTKLDHVVLVGTKGKPETASSVSPATQTPPDAAASPDSGTQEALF